jgi:multiple sugar transport system ATP-binding protein
VAEVILESVGKVYPGNIRAVKDVNLDIRNGEFLVLVGPSGCGKSTTLRMVAGLEDISEGTIKIGERVVNDLPPKDRDIAMVFQNYALYPHMTVYENMAFGLKLRKFKKPDIDERVKNAARLLGIEMLLERKPKALSGGQRQRVAVGRAIVREPAAFLFDEPLSNLDAKLRVETRAELKRLHKRLQTTTIYVTHDQEEAMTLGDRIVVMSEGLVQQVDTPLEIYERPVNRFVAGFLGTPPMNFIDGKLVRAEGKLRFEGEELSIVVPDFQTRELEAHVDQPVVLGMRPENLYQMDEHVSGSDVQKLTLQVDVVEPLGNTMDLYLSTATGARLVARVKASLLDGVKHIDLKLDASKLYVFEPGLHGQNLTFSPS